MARTKRFDEYIPVYIEIYKPITSIYPDKRTFATVSIIHNSNYGPKSLQVRHVSIWLKSDWADQNDREIKETVRELRRWAKKNGCSVQEEKTVSRPVEVD